MRSKSGIACLVIGFAAAFAPQPASAGRAGAISPTAYYSGAFYRALLLCRPPAYWTGGTMFVALVPTPAPRNVAVVPPSSPKPPARPLTLRVPGKYLEAALGSPHPDPLWVKTARGFRLDDSARP